MELRQGSLPWSSGRWPRLPACLILDTRPPDSTSLFSSSSQHQLLIFIHSLSPPHSLLRGPSPLWDSSYVFLFPFLWFTFYTHYLCSYVDVVGGDDGVRW